MLSVPESLLDGGINEIHMKLQCSFCHLQFSSTNSLELVKEQWSSYREQCLDYLNATAPAAGEALSSQRESLSALNASRRQAAGLTLCIHRVHRSVLPCRAGL